MPDNDRSGSLSANLMTLVLMVVGVSMTVISIVALIGVFDLASDQVAAQQRVFRQATRIQLTTHLDGARRVLDRCASTIVDPTSGELNTTGLSEQYEAGSEYVDRVFVADEGGTIRAVFPTYLSARTGENSPILARELSDEPAFVFDPEPEWLWAGRSVEVEGETFLIAERVRIRFLPELLGNFASEAPGRWVGVVGADGSVVASGSAGIEPDHASIELEPIDSDGRGSVTAADADGSVLWGQHSPMGEYPGLDWSIVVLEPRDAVVESAMDALAPAVLAVLVAALFAVVFAGVFSRRLVVPIKDLESRAREAVRGAYVRPIETDRTDELGQLVEAFNAVALRLNALHDLSQLLASTSNLDQVLDGILSAMGHIVGSARVAVFLFDEAAGTVSLVRSRGLDHSVDFRVDLDGDSWVRDAFDSNEPIVFDGVPADDAEALGLPAAGPVTVLAAPLIVGAAPLGLVAVFDISRRTFTQAETEMVRTFSAQAAVAVRNSRLFAEESASRLEAEALRAVAERLAQPSDLENALADVVAVANDLLQVADASFAIVDRASLGLPPAEEPAAERALLRAWGRSLMLRADTGLMTVRAGEDPVVDEFLRATNGSRVMFVTAMRGGEPGAVIAFVIDREGRVFTGRDVSLADAIGDQVTLALENAYHLEQARGRALNLETVFRISQAVSSSLQIKVVLNRVLDVVQKIFTADTVSLMTYDESARIIKTVMARGSVSNELLHLQTEPGHDVAGVVFSTGTPAKIDDLVDSDGELAAVAVRQGLHSALAVPLMARGRALGVLSVFAASPALFTEEDMGLLHTFASQAALAIDTADLYGREHEISSVLQSSILPETLPEVVEVETSSVYRAAGEGVEIGGDYYDLFRLPDGGLLVAIGDVAGKGVTAATKTSMMKYTVRGLAAAGLSPSEIISEVNRAVSETGAPNDIVTLWVGVIEDGGESLRYANGGHPPALLYRAEGDRSVERMVPTGPLLGAMAGAPYDEEHVILRPGDLVLMYTDGVTEARRGNNFFGEGRVRRTLRHGGTPREVIERLLAALDRFVAGPLRDDAAVLVFCVRGRATGDGRKERAANKVPDADGVRAGQTP